MQGRPHAARQRPASFLCALAAAHDAVLGLAHEVIGQIFDQLLIAHADSADCQSHKADDDENDCDGGRG
mgnify:CR=1 FL=1